MNHNVTMISHSNELEILSTSHYTNSFNRGVISNRGNKVAYDALQSGSDHEGGYLVPDSMEKQIIEALTEENIIRKLARVIHTDSCGRLVPIAEAMSDAQWMPEGEQMQLSDKTFSQAKLRMHKLGIMLRVTNELLSDAGVDMATYIAESFARRIALAEENAFLNGNGITMPQGILTESGAETGFTLQSQNSITADEVIALYYSLRAPYRKHAVFMMHDDTAKALRQMKDSNGNYIWHDSLSYDQPSIILGCPVFTSEYMPKMQAGNKPILFGDLSFYWIADRGNRSICRYDELYVSQGQTGFRVIERVDGRLLVPEAAKVIQMAA